MNDAELKKELEQIYNTRRKQYAFRAYRDLKDQELAAEVVSETFLKAVERRAQCREPNKLQAWVDSIFRNTLIETIKSSKRRKSHESPYTLVDDVESERELTLSVPPSVLSRETLEDELKGSNILAEVQEMVMALMSGHDREFVTRRVGRRPRQVKKVIRTNRQKLEGFFTKLRQKYPGDLPSF